MQRPKEENVLIISIEIKVGIVKYLKCWCIFYRMQSGLIAKINVILFARPPIAGEAKTRLSQDIGDKEAIKIYKKLLTKSVSAVSDVNSLGKTISTYGLEEYPSDLALDSLALYLQHERRTMLERLSDAFGESHKTYNHTLVVCADIPNISNILNFCGYEQIAR